MNIIIFKILIDADADARCSGQNVTLISTAFFVQICFPSKCAKSKLIVRICNGPQSFTESVQLLLTVFRTVFFFFKGNPLSTIGSSMR